MQRSEETLEHALHNDAAMRHLDKTDKYLDWVITMCFYSALHFVRYKIFPLTESTDTGNKFKHIEFDAYCKYYKHKNLSKHRMLQILVEEHHPTISAHYSQLMDYCSTARYHRYKYSRVDSNRAKILEDAIKKYCMPVDATTATDSNNATPVESK